MRWIQSLLLFAIVIACPTGHADTPTDDTTDDESAAVEDPATSTPVEPTSADADTEETAANSVIPAGRMQPADDVVEQIDPVVIRDTATQDRLDAVAHFMAGQLFEKRRDPASAIVEYEQALVLDPNEIKIYRSFVPIGFLLGRGDAVVDAALQAATRFDDGHDLVRGLAGMMASTNRIDDATKLLTETLNIPRVRDRRLSRLLVHRDLGVIFRASGKNTEAAQQLRIVFEATIANDPEFSEDDIKSLYGVGSDSFEEMGTTFLDAELPDLAVKAFAKAAEADPSTPAVHSYHLASVFQRTARPEEALEQLEKYLAAQLQTKGRDAYLLLESLLTDLGRADELLPKLKSLVEVDRRNTALRYFYADKLRDVGQLEEAGEQYRVALGGGRDLRGLVGLMSLLRLGDERTEKVGAELADLILKAYPVVAQSGDSGEGFEEEWNQVKQDEALVKVVASAGLDQISSDQQTLEFLPAYLFGRLMVDAERPSDAAAFYRYALKTRSDPPVQLFLEIGQFLDDSEEFTLAAEFYKDAIDTVSDKRPAVVAELYYHLSNALSRSDQADKALAAIRNSMAAQPDNINWQFWEGVIAYEGENYEQAAQIYRDFIDRHAKSGEAAQLVERAKFQLSVVYVQQGDTERGAQVLLDILEVDPDNVQANNDLGYLWADEGVNLDRAEGMIRKAVEAEPDNAAYLDSLGWVLFRTNRSEEAIPYLKQAAELERGQDTVIFEHLGDAYLGTDAKAEARSAFERALELEREKASPDTEVVARIEAKLTELGPAKETPLGSDTDTQQSTEESSE